MSDPAEAPLRPPQPAPQPVRLKVRLRFRKDGALRLVSHHDLMRVFERMLRRAALPFKSTEGFHPKPRIAFALSLPLGVVGAEEVVELELNEEVSAAEVRHRLAAEAPAGLSFLSAVMVEPRVKAQARRVSYRVEVVPEEGTANRVTHLLAAAEAWVDRARPHAKRINVRPWIDQIRILPAAVDMDLWVTPAGLARPDEVLGLLGLGSAATAQAAVVRTRVELVDEAPVGGPTPLS